MDGLALPHCAKGVAVCAAAKLNVRKDPTTNAKIAGQLVKDELVTVWALADEWMIVQAVNGLTGWALAQYLTVDGVLTP